MNYYKNFIKPILFQIDAEKAHNLAIWALKNNILKYPKIINYNSLKVTICGIEFDNPIAMAAGFDKNAKVISSLFKFGFGSIECGTVTPKSQIGNVKPRIFRLKEDKAIINRLGFNNVGIEGFLHNLKKQSINQTFGINIGKNKDQKDAAADYLSLLERVYGLSSYITINISSPNTKDLRNIQQKSELDLFLQNIAGKKSELIAKTGKIIPIFLKIAPDLNQDELKSIADNVLKNQIDAVIISNSTISRNNLKSQYQSEDGGLTGKPLFDMSNEILSRFYQLTEGKIPLIASGGVFSASDAYEKIKIGASMVQIYSAFIYEGFSLVEKIKEDLNILLKNDNFGNISEAIAKDVAKYN
ncbi:quinone-dependent dihydroorotate dehydrogenase [Rickettsiales bacterium]|nr:quinone-dependent dihydroorotate dehydrogenase [Rickettsiales bacterium]